MRVSPDLAQVRASRRVRAGLFLLVLFAAALGEVSPASALPEQIKSYAVVRGDASLTVQGWRIHLFGIYLPPSERVCESRIRPVRCGSRAAGALRTKITGFVDCRPQFAYNDGSISAVCRTGRMFGRSGVDLGAWLIEEGLALAGPDAPFSYRALERIAQSQERGIWGRFVDEIR